jgi:hypothetical protein
VCGNPASDALMVSSLPLPCLRKGWMSYAHSRSAPCTACNWFGVIAGVAEQFGMLPRSSPRSFL